MNAKILGTHFFSNLENVGRRGLFLILLFLSVGLLGGCAATSKGVRDKPDWIDGPSARYPNENYLVGRGQAVNIDEAKDRARADLAKTFEVAIAEQTRDIQTFTRQTGDGDTQVSSRQDLSRQIATRTEQVVRGIDIADLWHDPLSKNQYALAVLDRNKAARALREQIDQLDDATAKYVSQARAEPDALRKIAIAAKALESQTARAGLQRSLQIVDKNGRGKDPVYKTAELRADLDQMIGRVRLTAMGDGAYADDLTKAVAGALTKAGFTVDAAAGDYRLTANLTLDDLGAREGWHWLRGTLETKMADNAGNVRTAKRWEVKVSGQEKATAERRAIDNAAALLQKHIFDAVLEVTGD